MSASKCTKEGTAIQVFARIRPLGAKQKPAKRSITISTDSIEVEMPHNTTRSYVVDEVFPAERSQEYFYQHAIKPVVSEVLNGYNCTVFAYGQTGSGKTYTMIGPDATFTQKHDVGVIPRAFEDIWSQLNANSVMRVSYLEIYNEVLRDLLDDSVKVLKIYEDPKSKGTVRVHGLHEVAIKSPDEFYDILRSGAEKRCVAETLMNQHSSRSHTVFTLTTHVNETTADAQHSVMKIGKLNLVDLAGSENAGRSGAQAQRAREASKINQSLLSLGRVVKALVEKHAHVPYRQAKLTRILQDSLGGRTKTTMVVTISTAASNLEETLSTLEYASHARHIFTMPEINSRMTAAVIQKKYVEVIGKLQRDIFANRTGDGIYLNEDNYKVMVETRSALRSNVLEIVAQCANYESQLSELEDMRTQLEDVFRVTQHDLLINTQLYDDLLKMSRQMRRNLKISDELIAIFLHTDREYEEHNRELENALDAHIDEFNRLHSKMRLFYKAGADNKHAGETLKESYARLIAKAQQSVSELEALAIGKKVPLMVGMKNEYVANVESFFNRRLLMTTTQFNNIIERGRQIGELYLDRARLAKLFPGPEGKEEERKTVFSEEMRKFLNVKLCAIATFASDLDVLHAHELKMINSQRKHFQRHSRRLEEIVDLWRQQFVEIVEMCKTLLNEMHARFDSGGRADHEMIAKMENIYADIKALIKCVSKTQLERKEFSNNEKLFIDAAHHKVDDMLSQFFDHAAQATKQIIEVNKSLAQQVHDDAAFDKESVNERFMRDVIDKVENFAYATIDMGKTIQFATHERIENIIKETSQLQFEGQQIANHFTAERDSIRNEFREDKCQNNVDARMNAFKAMNTEETRLVERVVGDISDAESTLNDCIAVRCNPQKTGDTPQRIQKHVTYTMPRKIKTLVLQDEAGALPIVSESGEDDSELLE